MLLAYQVSRNFSLLHLQIYFELDRHNHDSELELSALLTTCLGNRLRTVTSDQTVYNNSSLSFSIELMSVRHHWIEIIDK